MHNYNVTELTKINLEAKEESLLGILAINRPSMANAFNSEVVEELISQLDNVKADGRFRALVITGRGKHFSAGADLAWMQKASDLTYDDNIADATKLSGLMETLCHLPIPTIAVVKGSVFGGGLGLVAACDFALCDSKAKFCLSEVKLGILPAIILPYVARKITFGQLRRLSLGARLFTAEEARGFGLVERMTSGADELRIALLDELNLILKASPEAQRRLKRLIAYIYDHSLKQSPETAKAIAEARVSPSGQLGLRAFLNKTDPSWISQVRSEDLETYEF